MIYPIDELDIIMNWRNDDLNICNKDCIVLFLKYCTCVCILRMCKRFILGVGIVMQAVHAYDLTCTNRLRIYKNQC